jgi:hypothetical protein
VQLLLNMCLSNVVCIAWKGISPTGCVAKNGVKRGGALNPVLFCIYIDDYHSLTLKLVDTKVGCWLGPVYVGALAYAEDIVLMAPSANAMRCVLSVCK